MTNDLEAVIGVPYAIKKPIEKKATEDVFAALLEKYNQRMFAEKKGDGNRVQVHIKQGEVMLYSSGHNEWNTECFPELTDLSSISSGIYAGELLGKGGDEGIFRKEDEFRAVSKRPKQKVPKNLDELVNSYPLKIDFFDILNLEGEDVTNLPYEERRELLKDAIKGENLDLSELYVVTSVEELNDVFASMKERKLEGLVVKDPGAPYTAKRDDAWCKLKIYTTWDLVVLGAYETETSKKKGALFASLLCGVYNQDTSKYETLVKLPVSGRKKVDEISALIEEELVPADAEMMMNSEKISFSDEALKVQKKMPDYLIDPDKSIVLEVKALRVSHSENTWHSCGYDGEKAHSLEIISYQQIREDKTDALRAGSESILPTTTQDIQMYCF